MKPKKKMPKNYIFKLKLGQESAKNRWKMIFKSKLGQESTFPKSKLVQKIEEITEKLGF